MGRTVNLIGKTFGLLRVIEKIGKDKASNALWLCECSCDKHTRIIVKSGSLMEGRKWHCGCKRLELRAKTKRYNSYDISGDFGIGYTKYGDEFFFDLEDYNLIQNYHWRKTESGHITSLTRLSEEGKEEQIFMHRLVLGLPNKKGTLEGEHINGIAWDNRKTNLEVVDHQENMTNKKLYKNNTSGHVGVNLRKNGTWAARLCYKNKMVLYKEFDDFNDAVACREEAELKYFGKLCRRDK